MRTLIPHGSPVDSSAGSSAQMLDPVATGTIADVAGETAIDTYLLADPQLAVVAVPNRRFQGSPEYDG